MKKLLYIIYIPLLLTEWIADMLLSIVKVVHNSIETLTLVLQREINEPISKAPGTESQLSNPEPKQEREQLSDGRNILNGSTADDRRAVSRIRR